jgi:hypothetical protein
MVLDTGFTDVDALVTLLTAETLLFAALTIVLAFNEVAGRVPALPFGMGAEQLGWVAAAVVAIVAFGAVVAWWDIFGSFCTWNFTRGSEAVSALVGVVAQPLLAIAIARGLHSRS